MPASTSGAGGSRSVRVRSRRWRVRGVPSSQTWARGPLSRTPKDWTLGGRRPFRRGLSLSSAGPLPTLSDEPSCARQRPLLPPGDGRRRLRRASAASSLPRWAAASPASAAGCRSDVICVAVRTGPAEDHVLNEPTSARQRATANFGTGTAQTGSSFNHAHCDPSQHGNGTRGGNRSCVDGERLHVPTARGTHERFSRFGTWHCGRKACGRKVNNAEIAACGIGDSNQILVHGALPVDAGRMPVGGLGGGRPARAGALLPNWPGRGNGGQVHFGETLLDALKVRIGLSYAERRPHGVRQQVEHSRYYCRVAAARPKIGSLSASPRCAVPPSPRRTGVC